MRPQHSPAAERLALVTSMVLIPRVASAHGEQLLVVMFYEAVAIPWAIIVFLVARRQGLSGASAKWIGLLTLLTTAGTFFGAWLALFAATKGVMEDPTVLSPLLLIIAAAPGVGYLLKARSYRWVLALVLIPILLTGSCVGMSR
jgi:hypothetical protein